MKRIFVLSFILLSFNLIAQEQKNNPEKEVSPELTQVWEPIPQVVTPGKNNLPPSDAVVLFDGNNFKEWEHLDGKDVQWKLDNEAMTVVARTGDIQTKRSFGDCQLHIEFRIPTKVEGDGQDRGNSGIFLQSRYEVQVLDNFNSRTYSNGQAGAIYKQHIPLVNACRPPEEWQTYDLIFKAPVFNEDGIKVASGTITVLHNGVLVQNHSTIFGTTENKGWPKNIAHGKAPIKLQDHGNPVSFRNIWIREL